MGQVHRILRWANRREIAREVTRRGYRLSGETLNRWVRDEAEFPAFVEHVILELFEATPDTQKTAPPWWGEAADVLFERAEGLVADVPAIRRTVDELAEEVAVLRTILGATPPSSQPPGDDQLDGPSTVPHGHTPGR